MNDVAAAFRAACFAELQALKPGNVHIYAAGHRMRIDDFERSAEAAAPFVAERGASVGRRILEGVRASRAVVDDNINLGIILLCAPLAAAAECGQGLRAGLSDTLAALTIEDANSAFAAIALAQPAGLGARPDHDVREPARITLLDAMRLAAEEDRIARAYAEDFKDIFDLGLKTLNEAEARFGPGRWAATAVYLAFLSTFPDTHIARKFGLSTARLVMEEAQAFSPLLSSDAKTHDALLTFDADLKHAGLNPGASADLTVATLFAAALDKFLGSL